MVQFIKALPLLACAVGTAYAQHTQLIIPEVSSYVSTMHSQFAQYTGYLGPLATGIPLPLPKPNTVPVPEPAAGTCDFWMENIAHKGIQAFNNDTSYVVFRNVKDYGAKGDGVADDTNAINNAISSGNRFGPAAGQSSSNTLAVVYFPAGTYLISTSIIDYYYTQLIGNPNCMPVLKATANFNGFGLIDGDKNEGFGATNIFYRQVRNFVFDMTGIAGVNPATGIHWPTAQATSLQNCIFKMSQDKGTQHQGVFIDSGSGGWVTDLVFIGGLYGMNQGNQQFTMRNLTFNNVVVAISQIWDWGWTYKGITVNNCTLGFNMSQGGSADQSVAAVVIIDSVFSNTPVGISTAWTNSSSPASSGSLILENVQFNNVPTAVQGPKNATYLAGTKSSMTVAGYAQGHAYNPSGPVIYQKSITGNPRSANLVGANGFYQQSKPQYETIPASSFISARTQGAVGNGMHDDSTALQKAINLSASSGNVLFIDAGTYKVTKTLTVPPGARIVGEGYSVIMSAGAFFNNIMSPQPMIKVGTSGQSGRVEMSDLILSTQGAQGGAILLEWNLASPAGTPSGLWDVHTRIGGTMGSNLQGNNCPTTPGTVVKTAKRSCYGAFMSAHITSSASGLYLENNWFWTADHDVDANYGGNQITVYTGRGILIEATNGPLWLYGTAAEHHSLYQYQLYGTGDIFMGQIQTETAYWQPNPAGYVPFPANATYHDPVLPKTAYGPDSSVPNADGFALRVVNSKPVFIYGAGFYSFFDNYSTTCSNQGNGETCQSRIFSVESGSQVYLYDLHVVGTKSMITNSGTDVASYADNLAGFTDEIILYRTG